MILIDGDPGFSPDIADWKKWLNKLNTDPFFVKNADDESVIWAIEHAKKRIELLEYIELEQQTRPAWVEALNKEAGINQLPEF